MRKQVLEGDFEVKLQHIKLDTTYECCANKFIEEILNWTKSKLKMIKTKSLEIEPSRQNVHGFWVNALAFNKFCLI